VEQRGIEPRPPHCERSRTVQCEKGSTKRPGSPLASKIYRSDPNHTPWITINIQDCECLIAVAIFVMHAYLATDFSACEQGCVNIRVTLLHVENLEEARKVTSRDILC